MDEFYQKQGRDWIRYTLTDEGVRKEENWNNNLHSTLYKFEMYGRLSGDYTYFDNKQRAIPAEQRRTVLITAIVVAILCFGGSGALAGPDNKTTAGTIILMVTGWVELLAIILYMQLRVKKLRTKLLRFDKSSEKGLAFYARNAQDEDQINSFEERYRNAWTTWLRKEFTKDFNRALGDGRVATRARNYRDWLTSLHEEDQLFSDEEYHEYLDKIQAAVDADGDRNSTDEADDSGDELSSEEKNKE